MRRASLADEEAHRMTTVESVAGESSFKYVAIAGGIADSVVADKETTEGVHITEVVGSGELDPTAC